MSSSPQIKPTCHPERSEGSQTYASLKTDPLDRAAAIELLQHVPLDDLLSAATTLRAKGKGNTITFSKKVFIPLTTLCRDYCGYCTFRKDPGQPGAHFMTPDEVLAVAEQGRRAGCKEALFSLGDQPERIFPEARDFLHKQGFTRTLDYLAAMCELVLNETGLLPHSNPGVMDANILARLKESNASVGLMLETVSNRLMRGDLPHANAPDKVPVLRLRTMEEAGKLSIAFTTGILIGIGETIEERIDSLIAIRAMHEKYGHIQEVIIQNFRAKPDIPMAHHIEPTMDDMLRTIAVARLILGPDMNIQAPPNLSYSDFPRLLDAGINDWGGISPITKDHINPEAAWPQIAKLEAETNAHGFVLRERLALYPEFLDRQGFTSSNMRPHLDRMRRGPELAQAPQKWHPEVAIPNPCPADKTRASRAKTAKPNTLRIAALAGGVGASKLLLGLYDVMDPIDLTAIVNTGDDITLHGLKISPDLDIVTYTLAGLIDPKKGWGFRGETFHLLKRLAVFGRINWFNLGDRDLATHIHRTAMLSEGKSLTDAAESIRVALGVKSRILPMCNDPVPTIIESSEGALHFQEYLVKRRAEPVVKSIRFDGVEHARPAPGVLDAIHAADRVIICPSNPLISIGPILAVKGIREALRARRESVVAVCPIVGGKSLKGPSDKMLAELGHEASARGVAKLYADFTGRFVIDPADESQYEAIESLGMKLAVLPTVMATRGDKRKLARALLTL